eukprot:TRINITY_DN58302_c0_g1_i1.p1 TRINITY_DN58302_c0_g1~~TRINITY_DN58302_c0_g1_i1.p1  ORF type:complete len:176 (+),score=37.55 TRINITY_DN58302_c0_g1_i1:55-528(+)
MSARSARGIGLAYETTEQIQWMGDMRTVVTHVNVPTTVEKSRRTQRAARIKKWHSVLQKETKWVDRSEERLKLKSAGEAAEAAEAQDAGEPAEGESADASEIPRLPITGYTNGADGMPSARDTIASPRDLTSARFTESHCAPSEPDQDLLEDDAAEA